MRIHVPDWIVDNIEYRIEADLKHFKGEMPERYAIAWAAYLEALLEWNVLDTHTYDRLAGLLPDIEGDDPVDAIAQSRRS